MRFSQPHISNETRAFVVQRDWYMCQMCGAASGAPHHHDVGHKTLILVGYKSVCGGAVRSNLRAICSFCNEGLRLLADDRPSLKRLLIQLPTEGYDDRERGWAARRCAHRSQAFWEDYLNKVLTAQNRPGAPGAYSFTSTLSVKQL
jgi:hypothetical protein